MKKRLLALAALAAGTAMADVGDVVATSAGCTFRINTKDSVRWSYDDDAVSSFPVTWRKGETVTATAYDGTEATGYPSSASSDGELAFAATKGGVWTLVNSVSGTAYIVVPFGVDEIGDVVATSASEGFGIDTLAEGPNRKGKKRELLTLIAFSGDDWAGNASAESTLRFTAPDSTITEYAKTGTGAQAFTFNKAGAWTVELIVDSVVVKTATINATSGLVIIVK